jgi:hypothetical protein
MRYTPGSSGKVATKALGSKGEEFKICRLKVLGNEQILTDSHVSILNKKAPLYGAFLLCL